MSKDMLFKCPQSVSSFMCDLSDGSQGCKDASVLFNELFFIPSLKTASWCSSHQPAGSFREKLLLCWKPNRFTTYPNEHNKQWFK